jgi:hypothetical protein
MSKVHPLRQKLITLLALSLWFCSFLLQHYIKDSDYSVEQIGSNPLGTSSLERISTDQDTHEDDLELPREIMPHHQADIASQMRGDLISYLSHLPNPTIPPPKAI